MVSPPNGPRHVLKVYGTAETMTCEVSRRNIASVSRISAAIPATQMLGR